MTPKAPQGFSQEEFVSSIFVLYPHKVIMCKTMKQQLPIPRPTLINLSQINGHVHSKIQVKMIE